MRSKVFFINGGSGRVLCSIPALEIYAKESGDEDFAIVAESGSEFFLSNNLLYDKVYLPNHKNLFKEIIKKRQIVQPEPYRVYEYYNQKCSIIQAFDKEINNLTDVREIKIPTLDLYRDEIAEALKLIDEIKLKTGKNKVIAFQPFGRGIQKIGNEYVDYSYRSIELQNAVDIIENLREDYTVLLMSQINLPIKNDDTNPIAFPQTENLRMWAALIKMSDHFLGCDSLGQHIARSVGTKSTVVLGSTYPVNVSYINDNYVDIIDLGENKRTYSPIRIIENFEFSRKNENTMFMTNNDFEKIIKNVRNNLGEPVKVKKLIQQQKQDNKFKKIS